MHPETFQLPRKSTITPDYYQAILTTIGLALCLAIFLVVERLVIPCYNFETQLDASIPFLPWTYVVYVWFFPFVVVLAAYASRERFKAFMLAVALSFIGAFLCFFLFPETMHRPDIALIENELLRRRFANMWTLDLAANGFPSLHVVVTYLACSIMGTTRFRKMIVTIGILIILSTLTVKQHTLIDVVGGIALACVAAALAERLLRPRVHLVAIESVAPER